MKEIIFSQAEHFPFGVRATIHRDGKAVEIIEKRTLFVRKFIEDITRLHSGVYHVNYPTFSADINYAF